MVMKAKLRFRSKKWATGEVLPPNPAKVDKNTAISETFILKKDLDDLINGYDGSVKIYGRITYTDAAGNPYETAFCFHTLRTHAVQYCEGNTNYIH